MEKKKRSRKSHPSKKLAHPNQKYFEKICLIDLEELREHEEIRPEYLEELKCEILSDGILKMPIAVDRSTYIILDGHHRLHALRRIGCKRIPVVLVDYQSPEIEVPLPLPEEELREAPTPCQQTEYRFGFKEGVMETFGDYNI